MLSLYPILARQQPLLCLQDATAKFLGHQWLMCHSNQRLLARSGSTQPFAAAVNGRYPGDDQGTRCGVVGFGLLDVCFHQLRTLSQSGVGQKRAMSRHGGPFKRNRNQVVLGSCPRRRAEVSRFEERQGCQRPADNPAASVTTGRRAQSLCGGYAMSQGARATNNGAANAEPKSTLASDGHRHVGGHGCR